MVLQKADTIDLLISYIKELTQIKEKREIIRENLRKISNQLLKNNNEELNNLNDIKEVIWKIRSYNL